MDPYCFAILDGLRRGPQTWGELRPSTKLTEPTLWKHLKELQTQGLVARLELAGGKGKGRPQVQYSLREPAPEFLETLRELESRLEDPDALKDQEGLAAHFLEVWTELGRRLEFEAPFFQGEKGWELADLLTMVDRATVWKQLAAQVLLKKALLLAEKDPEARRQLRSLRRSNPRLAKDLGL